MEPRDVLIDMDTEKLSDFYRESLINFISDELDVLEWTNHLKVSLKKVLSDSYVLGKLYLFIGEGAFLESRKNSHKAKGTFDLDIIRWKMNEDRNLLKYIGEKFGELKNDEYWYELIDPNMVKKAKMMAEPIPEKPMKYKEIKAYLNQKGFTLEKTVYENSRGEVVNTIIDIKKNRVVKASLIRNPNLSKAKILRIFNKKYPGGFTDHFITRIDAKLLDTI